MRWTRLLSVDARSLLRDSNQILTAFIDFTCTYCSLIILHLKCASMYDRIGRMREHDIVVGGVIVKSKDGVTALELHKTGLPHPVGITRLFCLGGYGIFILSYFASVCTVCQCHQTAAGGSYMVIPRDTKTNKTLLEEDGTKLNKLLEERCPHTSIDN
jgi:hypothetical protein